MLFFCGMICFFFGMGGTCCLVGDSCESTDVKTVFKTIGDVSRISLVACKTGVKMCFVVLKATPFSLLLVFKSAGVIHSVFVDHIVSMNLVSTVSFSFVHKMTDTCILFSGAQGR